MRLGDLDALKEVITANHYLLSSRNNSTDYGMFTTGIIQAIDNAPTVDVNSTIDGLNNEIDDLSENLAWYINERNRLLKERRPQGEWIVLVDEDNIQTCKCSICGRMVDIANREFDKFPYCHCGAKMKGGAENDKDSN